MDDGSQNESIARLVPGKGDDQVAAELRAELSPLLEQACKIFDRAAAHGMNVNWAISKDSFGKRHRVNEITVVKIL